MNRKSVIQPSEILPIELTGTHLNYWILFNKKTTIGWRYLFIALMASLKSRMSQQSTHFKKKKVNNQHQ